MSDQDVIEKIKAEGVDMSELAANMLEWEKLQKRADDLANWIKLHVMAMEKTQTVGNVRATYSAGRKSYDYEAGARAVFPENDPDALYDVAKIYEKTTIDWREMCEEHKIEDIPFTQGKPSVSVKLLD
jgi:hypothetical protein